MRNHCENSFKLKAIEVKTLNMPEKDFTDIKFETKIGRMMAFTMTKIRNHVIAKVNQRAKLLQEFKDEGLSHMMSIDILQEIQIFDWLNHWVTLDRPLSFFGGVWAFGLFDFVINHFYPLITSVSFIRTLTSDRVLGSVCFQI